MRKDKKKIEELEEALFKAADRNNSLKAIKENNEYTIQLLRSELADKDAKYAALLEKYIAMMEKAAKLNEQAIAPEREIVERIFYDIEAMLLKWFYENVYDAQLDTGVRELKEKYMGRSRQ